VAALCVAGCVTPPPAETDVGDLPDFSEQREGMDPQVMLLVTNLHRHFTRSDTNDTEITYELVCPVFGDEVLATYLDRLPYTASTNDVMTIRIEHAKKPMGWVSDMGLDATFDDPRELAECKIEDPMKIYERYMHVVRKLNRLYLEHYRKGRRGKPPPSKGPPVLPHRSP
jgi:hypothetical protein